MELRPKLPPELGKLCPVWLHKPLNVRAKHILLVLQDSRARPVKAPSKQNSVVDDSELVVHVAGLVVLPHLYSRNSEFAYVAPSGVLLLRVCNNADLDARPMQFQNYTRNLIAGDCKDADVQRLFGKSQKVQECREVCGAMSELASPPLTPGSIPARQPLVGEEQHFMLPSPVHRIRGVRHLGGRAQGPHGLYGDIWVDWGAILYRPVSNRQIFIFLLSILLY